MKIFIDADACPKIIKTILFKAAIRTSCELYLVANKALGNIPKHPTITMIQVAPGFDAADNYIIDAVAPGDLVITADIPLADQIVAKEALALNPSGQLYTKDNIKQFLGMRNFMTDLRATGMIVSGAKGLDSKQIQTFANLLDRHLAANFKP